MRILGVDPGLANTALVLLDGPRFVGAWTLKTKGDSPTPRFDHTQHRCDELLVQLRAVYDEIGEVDHIACELYRDIPGKLRAARGRWTTPLAIGRMTKALRLFSSSGHVVWQDPEVVMRRYSEHMRCWAAGLPLIAGSGLLTNEHLRSAGAHALYLRDCIRIKRDAS